ncbi:hypothetical protein [Pseudoalteromonas sp. R3]|uniref:DUF6966 domain-containing protein n=1 Tax=Pseudoalteromonas sp. R3 TaxID=1709477 RepID=UPI0006B57D43|nr:hypothetical protein [Pseudoalteromonas sp. R3]AZZ98454.1 hypothetical protein ELR70_15835 [Pseudoalteromonas sp. R3]
MSSKDIVLSDLKLAIEQLCLHLKIDKSCIWTDHFERQLKQINDLIEYGYVEENLYELSSSVRAVYGGMGSFNDYYYPHQSKERNELIKKYGSSRDLSSKVYDLALKLKQSD